MILLLLFALPGAATAADTLRGVALVIGESRYESPLLPALDNPRNDARAMDDLLGDLGFDVTRVLDGDRERLDEEIADFVKAAKGADVALVYYSGHGIEAGGENYLAPIDADLSTPAAAGKTLLPVKDLLDDLARTVPVTIMLLDACRTSSFPAGTMIQPPGAAEPVAASEKGLAELRGPTPVARPGLSPDSLGMVIGFAASPRQPALDGAPGEENSPYAAALLKHLGAGGYSFGDLMTMVSEEVYLKTKARQLPWVNSSLLRVLTFGKPIENNDPDETAIRDGRRQLLLTIAREPPTTRNAVESIAGAEDVPLDALYGMLKALSVDTSGGAADLEQQLREGAKQLRQFKEQQLGTASSDPELSRLSDLASRAQAEGAMQLALSYREKATARAEVLKGERDQLEAGLKADRLEIGATFASHAQVAALNFDYAKSAEMWGRAYDEVARWDEALAVTYKWGEADALRDQGDLRGDRASLERAIATYADAAALVSPDADPATWSAIENDHGWALYTLGERDSDPARLKQAIALLQAALDALPPDGAGDARATTRLNLANALSALGQRESDSARLEQAVALYQEALNDLPRDRYGFRWGQLELNLGTTLWSLGEREENARNLVRAVAALDSALQEIRRDVAPLEWALAQNAYGIALLALGTREHDLSMLNRAATAFNLALQERHEDNVPVDWAMSQANLGNVFVQLSDEKGGDVDLLNKALDAYRAALRQLTEARTPPQWALAQANIGTTLVKLAFLTGDRGPLQAAVEALDRSLRVRTEADDPQNWAMTQYNLARAYAGLGSDEVLPTHLHQAIDAANAALRQWTREEQPLSWARAKDALGHALELLGNHEVGLDSYIAAVAAYGEALEVFDPVGSPLNWLQTTQNQARTLASLGSRERGNEHLTQAIAQYRNVLTMVHPDTDPAAYGDINFDIAQCYSLLDDRGVPDQLPEVIAALEAALDGYGRDRFPSQWAELQVRIGNAHFTLSDRVRGDVDHLRAAIAAYGLAQQVNTRAASPLDWAQAENSIGMAYADLGKILHDRGLLQTARSRVAAAWDVFRAGDSGYDADFASRLADLDQAIANMS